MSEIDHLSQLTDWVVSLYSADAEPSPTRDYYLLLLRQGRGVPDAVGQSVDDLLEEVRGAVAREEAYNPRAHRARLRLTSSGPLNPQRLPRPALVRRIVQERVGLVRRPGPHPPREGRQSGPVRG